MLNKHTVQAAPSAPEISIPTSQWLTANEAAAYLRIAPRTILAWARDGKLKGHVLSGIQRQTWRFRQSDLDSCLREF
jgi:excisionase family DNA binding protein